MNGEGKAVVSFPSARTDAAGEGGQDSAPRLHGAAAERPDDPREQFDKENRLDRSRIVSVCGWCEHVNILNMQRRAEDVLLVIQTGQHDRISSSLTIFRNGEKLLISTTYCEKHRQIALKSAAAAQIVSAT